MSQRSKYLAIILAAGKGSRLDFDGPKPLFPIYGKPMIQHIFENFADAGSIDMLTVVGHKKEQLIKHIEGQSEYVHQKPQHGTGHAAAQCISQIEQYKNTFIFVADAPFISSDNIRIMINNHDRTNSDCTFLYSDFPVSLPYGRLIFNSENNLSGLIEEHNADTHIKNISTYFTSQYLFKSEALIDVLSQICPDKITGEYNLTESINIMIKQSFNLLPVYIEEYWKLIGINTIDDLHYIQELNGKQ